MVSVIIPTDNAIGYIDPLIRRLNEQVTDQPVELIVIDSSSSDGTAEYCLGNPDIRFIRIEKSEFRHGGTRNRAAKCAGGDILVFLTQDALPGDPFCLANLIRPLRDDSAAASYARQTARPEASEIEKLAREFNYPAYSFYKNRSDIERLGIKTFFFSNVCSAIKRTEFERLGGFPEDAIIDEDMLFAYRLIMSGEQIAYVSEAVILHSHNFRLKQQFRRNFDIGAALKMNGSILRCAKSETEGARFARRVLSALIAERKYAQALRFCMESFFKLSGYRMGMSYAKLPMGVVENLSLNRSYWENRKRTCAYEHTGR